MYGLRLSGLGDALSTVIVSGLMSNGLNAAQAATIEPLIQRTPDGTTGNVDPQYANLVLHPDGSFGPLSDVQSALLGDPNDPNNKGYAYWKGIIAANRYLIVQGIHGWTTIGAVSAPAAAAIMSTYSFVPGTPGQSVSTPATAAANAAAATEATAAQAATPVEVTAQPYMPPGTPATAPTSSQEPSTQAQQLPVSSSPMTMPGATDTSDGTDTGAVAPPLQASLFGGLSSSTVLIGVGLLALLLLKGKGNKGQ